MNFGDFLRLVLRYRCKLGLLTATKAPRQILSSSSENSIPATLAACGNKLVAVMPGNEFASRHQNPPFTSRRKSIRL